MNNIIKQYEPFFHIFIRMKIPKEIKYNFPEIGQSDACIAGIVTSVLKHGRYDGALSPLFLHEDSEKRIVEMIEDERIDLQKRNEIQLYYHFIKSAIAIINQYALQAKERT